MTDDNIPPGQPAEPVFKVPQDDFSSEIKNQAPKAKGSFLEQFLARAKVLFGKNPAGANKNLFASPVRIQGIDSVKHLLANGIDLDALNKFLTTVLVLLMVYSITITVNKKSSIGKLMQTISQIKFENLNSKEVKSYEPVDFYLGQVRERDIFNPKQEAPRQVIQEPTPAPVEPPKPKLAEIAKGLSVVGIAWGETPKAMIKDDATQETHFLKKGQMIGERKIEVKDILRDKVILGYEGEEMPL